MTRLPDQIASLLPQIVSGSAADGTPEEHEIIRGVRRQTLSAQRAAALRRARLMTLTKPHNDPVQRSPSSGVPDLIYDDYTGLAADRSPEGRRRYEDEEDIRRLAAVLYNRSVDSSSVEPSLPADESSALAVALGTRWAQIHASDPSVSEDRAAEAELFLDGNAESAMQETLEAERLLAQNHTRPEDVWARIRSLQEQGFTDAQIDLRLRAGGWDTNKLGAQRLRGFDDQARIQDELGNHRGARLTREAKIALIRNGGQPISTLTPADARLIAIREAQATGFTRAETFSLSFYNALTATIRATQRYLGIEPSDGNRTLDILSTAAMMEHPAAGFGGALGGAFFDPVLGSFNLLLAGVPLVRASASMKANAAAMLEARGLSAAAAEARVATMSAHEYARLAAASHFMERGIGLRAADRIAGFGVNAVENAILNAGLEAYEAGSYDGARTTDVIAAGAIGLASGAVLGLAFEGLFRGLRRVSIEFGQHLDRTTVNRIQEAIEYARGGGERSADVRVAVEKALREIAEEARLRQRPLTQEEAAAAARRSGVDLDDLPTLDTLRNERGGGPRPESDPEPESPPRRPVENEAGPESPGRGPIDPTDPPAPVSTPPEATGAAAPPPHPTTPVVRGGAARADRPPAPVSTPPEATGSAAPPPKPTDDPIRAKVIARAERGPETDPGQQGAIAGMEREAATSEVIDSYRDEIVAAHRFSNPAHPTDPPVPMLTDREIKDVHDGVRDAMRSEFVAMVSEVSGPHAEDWYTSISPGWRELAIHEGTRHETPADHAFAAGLRVIENEYGFDPSDEATIRLVERIAEDTFGGRVIEPETPQATPLYKASRYMVFTEDDARSMAPGPITDEKAAEIAAELNQSTTVSTLRGPNDNDPVTGEPFRAVVYRGSGREDAASIYGDDVQGPTLGDAAYYAITPEAASRYGPNVEETEVELRNPAVISSDNDLAKLMRVPRVPMTNAERVPLLKRLRDDLQSAGHDGVIVLLPAEVDVVRGNQSIKRLREIFDETQVIAFLGAGESPRRPANVVRYDTPPASIDPSVPQTQTTLNPPESAASDTPPASIDPSSIITVEGGLISVRFPDRPDRAILDILKEAGFRWSGKNRVWSAAAGPDRTAAAERALAEYMSPGATRPDQTAPKTGGSAAAGVKTAKKLREAAESTRSRAQKLLDPAISKQRNTARRARIAAGMEEEGRKLMRMAGVLDRLAEMHADGSIPVAISGITSFAALERMLHRSSFTPVLRAAVVQSVIRRMSGKKGIERIRRSLRTADDSSGWLRFYSPDQAKAFIEIAALAEKDADTDVDSRRLVSEAKDLSALIKSGIDSQRMFDSARSELNALGLFSSAEKSPEQIVRELERDLIGAKIPGFFPTPPALIRQLLDLADISVGMNVLEPSAGKGDILTEIARHFAISSGRGGASDIGLTAIEIHPQLASIIRAKADAGVAPVSEFLQEDFLSASPTFAPDRIVMNPPFEKRADLEHIRRAYDMLRPGGRLVSIISTGSLSSMQSGPVAFREWLEQVEGEVHDVAPGSFDTPDAFRPTGVNVKIVLIDKPDSRPPAKPAEPEPSPPDAADAPTAAAERVAPRDKLAESMRIVEERTGVPITTQEVLHTLAESHKAPAQRRAMFTILTDGGRPLIRWRWKSPAAEARNPDEDSPYRKLMRYTEELGYEATYETSGRIFFRPRPADPLQRIEPPDPEAGGGDLPDTIPATTPDRAESGEPIDPSTTRTDDGGGPSAIRYRSFSAAPGRFAGARSDADVERIAAGLIDPKSQLTAMEYAFFDANRRLVTQSMEGRSIPAVDEGADPDTPTGAREIIDSFNEMSQDESELTPKSSMALGRAYATLGEMIDVGPGWRVRFYPDIKAGDKANLLKKIDAEKRRKADLTSSLKSLKRVSKKTIQKEAPKKAAETISDAVSAFPEILKEVQKTATSRYVFAASSGDGVLILSDGSSAVYLSADSDMLPKAGFYTPSKDGRLVERAAEEGATPVDLSQVGFESLYGPSVEETSMGETLITDMLRSLRTASVMADPTINNAMTIWRNYGSEATFGISAVDSSTGSVEVQLHSASDPITIVNGKRVIELLEGMQRLGHESVRISFDRPGRPMVMTPGRLTERDLHGIPSGVGFRALFMPLAMKGTPEDVSVTAFVRSIGKGRLATEAAEALTDEALQSVARNIDHAIADRSLFVNKAEREKAEAARAAVADEVARREAQDREKRERASRDEDDTATHRSMADPGGLVPGTRQAPPPEWVALPAETPHWRRLVDGITRDARGDRIGIRSIGRRLARDLNVLLLVRPREQTSARHPGWYRPRGHIVRSRYTGDPVVLFHEHAHAISELIRDKGYRHGGAPGRKAALKSLTYDPSAPYASAHSAEEGFAELIRLIIMDPGFAMGLDVARSVMAEIDTRTPSIGRSIRDAARAYAAHMRRDIAARWRSQMMDVGRKETSAGSLIGYAMSEYVQRGLAPELSMRAAKRAMIEYAPTRAEGRKMLHDLEQEVGDSAANPYNAYQMLKHIPRIVNVALEGPGGLRVHSTLSPSSAAAVAEYRRSNPGDPTGDPKYDDLAVFPSKLRELFDVFGVKLPAEPSGHGQMMMIFPRSIKEIIDPVSGHWSDFEVYAQMRATLARITPREVGDMVYPGQKIWPTAHEGVDRGTLRRAVSDLEARNPGWRDVADELERAMASYLAVNYLSGELTAEQIGHILLRYEFYLPLTRQGESGPSSIRGRSTVSPSGAPRSAHGHGNPAEPLLSAIARKAHEAIHAYYWNRFMLSPILYAETVRNMKGVPIEAKHAADRMAIRLNLDTTKVATLRSDEMVEIIAKYIDDEIAAGNTEFEGLEGLIDPITGKIDREAIGYIESGFEVWRKVSPKAINIVAPVLNGVRHYYQINDPLLYRVFASGDDVGRILKVARTITAGPVERWKRAITNTVAFALRNAVRDPVTAMYFGPGLKRLIPFFFNVRGFISMMTGENRDSFVTPEMLSRTFRAITEEEFVQRRSAAMRDILDGIAVPGWSGMSSIERLLNAPGIAIALIVKPLELWQIASGQRLLATTLESAPRMGAYAHVKARGGSDEAAQIAADTVTGNFGDRPMNPSAWAYYRMAGFLNPTLQIMGQFSRLFIDPDVERRYGRILASTMAVGGATAIAWALAQLVTSDEDREDEKERHESDRMTHMRIGGLRLPFDYGIPGVVQSLVWQSLETFVADTPISRDAVLTRILQEVPFPSPIDIMGTSPVQLKAMIEVAIGEGGYSFHWREPIVPNSLLYADPPDRYYASTPHVYRRLGSLLNVSPIKLQYLIRNGLNVQLDEAMRLLHRAEDGFSISDLPEAPFIGRLFQREPIGWQSQSVRSVSELDAQYNDLQTRYRRLIEGGETDPDVLQSIGEQIEAVAPMHQAMLAITALGREARELSQQKPLDRTRIRELRTQMRTIAQDALVFAGMLDRPGNDQTTPRE